MSDTLIRIVYTGTPGSHVIATVRGSDDGARLANSARLGWESARQLAVSCNARATERAAVEALAALDAQAATVDATARGTQIGSRPLLGSLTCTGVEANEIARAFATLRTVREINETQSTCSMCLAPKADGCRAHCPLAAKWSDSNE